MRILVFGDSITQGFWDTDGGWVERLRKMYDERQVLDLKSRDDPTVFNLGISADNTENILNRLVAETAARTRHDDLPVVIVQIGVNDSSTTPGMHVPIEAYKRNLKAIIEKAKPVSSRFIFVGLSGCDERKTTPVFWGDYHYTNQAIKDYEAAMAEIAAKYEVPFIPVFDAFMEQVEAGAELLPDGLHPNNAGHQLMLEIVRPKLLDLLA